MISLEKNDDLMTFLKALTAICLVWLSDDVYSMISFITPSGREFIRDSKDIVGLITSLVILAVAVKKFLKKGKDEE